jgi:putative tricarboxylic transport membrane protein
MRRAEIVTAVLLGLLTIYLMWKSGEGPSWDPDAVRFANIGFIDGEGPGSGFWPFWLSLMMLISCVWIAINWWRRKSPPSQSTEPFLTPRARFMLYQVGGSLIVFMGLTHVIGYYGAIFLFLIYYLRILGRHSIRRTAAIALGVPVFSFFFFDVAMRIVLPKGYLEPLFIPLYAIFL